MRSGLDEVQVFETAVRRIGQAGALKKEFKKIGHPTQGLLRKLKQFLLGPTEAPFSSLDDFAPSARHTLEIAPEEARRFHHDFIGTEHVLLGLTQAQSGIAANVMRRLGVNSDTIRMEIEKIVGLGSPHEAAAKLPFTPRARRALQLAVSEAKALNHPVVSAEHILLGLLLEGSGVAALVLKDLGINAASARKAILKEFGSAAE